MSNREKRPTYQYRHLLIVLIATFLISPFLKSGLGNLFSALLLFYTMIVIIKSFDLPKLWVITYVAIATMAFVVQLNGRTHWIATSHQASLAIFPFAIFALYLGVAAYWIGLDIFKAPVVTVDTVKGGISIYFLIGYVWSFFYGIVATLNPEAFSQELVSQGSHLKAVHFSFTTLTTLGYGDIVPISEIALVLTNLEAIVGQMYSTVFIAILVGGYLSRLPNR